MSYKGENLPVSFHEGGLVSFENSDLLPLSAMVEGSRNIITEGGVRKKRGGTGVIHSRGSDPINGVFQFRQVDNNHVVTYDNLGVVKKSQNDSLGTLTVEKYPVFEVFNDNLYIANGSDILQLWDGQETALSPLASTKLPTDWSGTNQPSWIIKHGRGAAENLFAGGVSGKKRFIYVADGDDFSDDCMVQIVVNTGDGFGPVGVANFNGILWALGKNKPFYIDTSNFDRNTWFAVEAPWIGGVAHQNLLVRTPNDLICMSDDGEIYSVVAVRESNDYRKASLTRPSGLSTWIRRNLNLSKIDKFHAIYSVKTQSIVFFVIRGAGDAVNMALVYDTNKPPEQAWMLYDNLDSSCGYEAASVAEVKKNNGEYVLYSGGVDGNLWELEKQDLNDNENSYYAGFFTPYVNIPDFLRFDKVFDYLWLAGLAYGAFGTSVRVWVDGVEVLLGSIDLDGALVSLGDFDLGIDKLGYPEMVQRSLTLGFNGRRIQFEIYDENINQPLSLSGLSLDYNLTQKRLD